jgi:hypothetical protein
MNNITNKNHWRDSIGYTLVYIVNKEKFNQQRQAMDVSINSMRLVFDKSGMLERAMSDAF